MNFCLIPKMLVVWIEVSSHNVAGVRSDCSNDKDLAFPSRARISRQKIPRALLDGIELG